MELPVFSVTVALPFRGKPLATPNRNNLGIKNPIVEIAWPHSAPEYILRGLGLDSRWVVNPPF